MAFKRVAKLADISLGSGYCVEIEGRDVGLYRFEEAGPIYAMVGTGASVYVVALASALLGTWTYAALRPHLPHF